MLSPKIDLAAIDAQIQTHRVPDRHGIRFRFLTGFAYRYSESHGLTPEEQQALVACINERIIDWLPEERIAKEDWWVDFRWDDDIYEYGANNGRGRPSFYGFLPQAHWLMPLARTAVLDNPTVKLKGKHLVDFLNSNAFTNLEVLLLESVEAEAAEAIMTSEKFTHLRVFTTPNLSLPKSLYKAFVAWKKRHGILEK